MGVGRLCAKLFRVHWLTRGIGRPSKSISRQRDFGDSPSRPDANGGPSNVHSFAKSFRERLFSEFSQHQLLTPSNRVRYRPDRDDTIAEKGNERLDTKSFAGARQCLKNLSSIAIGPTLRHIYHSTVLRNVSGATPVPKCCIPPSRTHFTAPSPHQMNGCPDVSGPGSLP
jgi:hypothetical protein